MTAIQVTGTPGGSSSSSGYSSAIIDGAAITGVALAVSFLVPKPPGDAEVG